MPQKAPLPTLAQKEFDAWWLTIGYPMICRMALYPSAPLLRNLCEIAYWQGRMDETVQQQTQLQAALKEAASRDLP